MSFLKPLVMTKKRFKFHVTFVIDELDAVPFVTDVLYCKLRLKNGGTYSHNTARKKVTDHCVCWRQRFEYTCKLLADPRTGILDPCIVRLSVRKEVQGGKSANKIGFVDLNLAEFAGSGQMSRHCLLEGYDNNNRLANSILKIVVGMQLLSGDPLFKIPTVQRDTALKLPSDSPELPISRVDSDSSGNDSLSRRSTYNKRTEISDSFELSHTRNSSSVSQHSRRSEDSSQHSRTPSSISQTSNSMDTVTEVDSGLGCMTVLKSPYKIPSQTCKMGPPRPPPPHSNIVNLSQNRMGETRVCADDVVDKLMENQDFTHNTSGSDGDNLQLYVASDGSTALGGQTLHNRVGSGVYHPVVFETSSTPLTSQCNT